MTPDNPPPDAPKDTPAPKRDEPAAKPGQAEPRQPQPTPQPAEQTRPKAGAPQARHPASPGEIPATGPDRSARRLLLLRLCIFAAAVVITFFALGYANIFGTMFARLLLGHLPIENIRIKPAASSSPVPAPPPQSKPGSVLPPPKPGVDFPEDMPPAVKIIRTPTPSPTPIPVQTPASGEGQGRGGGDYAPPH